MGRIATFASVLIVLGLGLALEASAQTVTYEVFLTRSDAGPPYTAFQDCMTFEFVGADISMDLEGCGGSPGAAGTTGGYPGILAPFAGTTCLGVQDMLVFGWFMNGTRFGYLGDVIGGTILSQVSPKTWGFEGVRNDACTLP